MAGQEIDIKAILDLLDQILIDLERVENTQAKIKRRLKNMERDIKDLEIDLAFSDN